MIGNSTLARLPRISTELTGDRQRTGAAWVRTFAGGRRLRTVPLDCDLDDGPARRGLADIHAAWHRWHQPGKWAGFASCDQPFWTLFDRVRVERLAASGWPGMATNMANDQDLAPAHPVLQPLYFCARHLAAADRAGAARAVERWRAEQGAPGLPRRLVRWSRLLGKKDLHRTLALAQVAKLSDLLQALLETDAWQPEVLVDAQDFANRIGPLVRRFGKELGPWLDGAKLDPAMPAAPGTTPEVTAEDDRVKDQGLAEPEAAIVRAWPGYAVFNHGQDETASAAHWYQPGDRAGLERLKAIDRRRVRQLAHRLQRRLQAARQRQWQFDQEDGLIDSRRLARLVSAGSDRRVFRRESQAPVPEAGVSLLVDLSGSMRGERRLSAALAIDLAVHVLEICGVHCEVLGYTTRYGELNPIERRWQAVGAPARPGRLNAIRHVVFKGARQPWRRSRRHLGLLLREDFGHENVDGEALDWATRRLFALGVQRRILVVLSDGAPFDQATATANGREFLSQHLRAVIARLDSLPMHLLALGTGTDVSRFYQRSVVLDHPASVAEVLFRQLGDLLTRPAGARDSR